MAHAHVVNGLLSLFERPRYLEIGVYEGATFIPARAARKVAVDPAIRFSREAAEAAGESVELHEVVSDRWFGEIAGPGDVFDVIFLDGLHTFEQTLRDLLNAMERLAPGGVILVDDVRPDSELAGLPDYAEARRRHAAGEPWNGHWMGDAYRLVFFVDTFLQGWSFRCTSDNLGQMVLWRQPRSAVRERALAEIAGLPAAAVAEQAAVFRFAPFADIRTALAARPGLRAAEA